MTITVKVSALGVCVSPGYSCVVLCTVVLYLSSRFFHQLHLSRLWLVIVSLVFLNFVTTAFLSFFLHWCSHSCNNEKSKFVNKLFVNLIYWYSHSWSNEKSKFVKKLFVNLVTVAVFYCRYLTDKDMVESFYKKSLFLVQ